MITLRKDWSVWLFCLLLLVGAFLRLYRLPYTMQFLGDQGRDALIARGILLDHDPAFIGPVTSVGNMYLGPFYYYFMVFPLLLTYPSPVGPAYAVAVVGILTLALLYILGKDIVGKRAALLAMFLYAISPTVIENVRFSWNPNIVPFFSLVVLWALYSIQTTRSEKLWMVIGVCAAAIFQLHYISLALIGLIGMYWVFHLYTIRTDGKRIREVFTSSVLATGIFFLTLTPLLVFDATHGWMNARSFLQFFDTTPGKERHFRSLLDGTGVLNAWVSLTARTIVEFFGIKAQTIGQKILLTLFSLYFLFKSFIFEKDVKRKEGKGILFFFLAGSLAILSLYSSSLFDHYLGFALPFVFLGLGVVLDTIFSSLPLFPLGVVILAVLSYTSILFYPGKLQLGANIYSFERTAQTIASHLQEGETFNLLLYSQTKDLQAMNYRYFLTTLDRKPLPPDDWINFETLVILDEENRDNPFDESQYVIKIWPNRKIVDSFAVPNGPKVYILHR